MFINLYEDVKMFNLEIERKIVDFVKKSPLGATSSDIANNFGLNRMTITKYLAIIKERTLIDFKQFGMAKLWYIPINLNKESFLSKAMANLAINIPKEQLRALYEKAGISLGEEINQMYLKFNNAKKLNLDQITDAYEDIGKKLRGMFKITSTSEIISVEITKTLFEENNTKTMNIILSAVFAKIASLNLGYAKTIIKEEKDKNTVIEVYLKKGK